MNNQIDTIYIELNVTANLGYNEVYMSGDIEIRINNILPYNNGDIVIEKALGESLLSEGEFHIFSCSCGVPECSGWVKGIKVSRLGEFTYWEDQNTKQRWIFKTATITQQINVLDKDVKAFKAFFEKKGINYVGAGY